MASLAVGTLECSYRSALHYANGAEIAIEERVQYCGGIVPAATTSSCNCNCPQCLAYVGNQGCKPPKAQIANDGMYA